MALRPGRRVTEPVRQVRPPDPHPSGAVAPAIPAEFVPRHVALVMDGNGRWAQDRDLPRTEGHKRGEAVLMDAVCGCIELGVQWLSAYAFSTENWSRSPDEVKFLMGFNRDVIRRRRDEMNEMGVRVRWAGRRMDGTQGRCGRSILVGDFPKSAGNVVVDASGVRYFTNYTQIPDPSRAKITTEQGLQARSTMLAIIRRKPSSRRVLACSSLNSASTASFSPPRSIRT